MSLKQGILGNNPVSLCGPAPCLSPTFVTCCFTSKWLWNKCAQMLIDCRHCSGSTCCKVKSSRSSTALSIAVDAASVVVFSRNGDISPSVCPSAWSAVKSYLMDCHEMWRRHLWSPVGMSQSCFLPWSWKKCLCQRCSVIITQQQHILYEIWLNMYLTLK